MQMLTVEGNDQEIRNWTGAFVQHVDESDPFRVDIAVPWFMIVGPERNRQYGVRGLNEMGSRGVLAQVMNCYFRWETLENNYTRWDEMRDVIIDAFGYSVLMGMVMKSNPEYIFSPWPNGIRFSMEYNYRWLRSTWLYGPVSGDGAVDRCFDLARGMYLATKERLYE
jgi:hypothetical protein